MNWLFLIILAAFLFAIVDVFDKIFSCQKIKSVYTLSVLTGIITVFFTSFLLFFVNLKIGLGWPLFFIVISQIFYFLLWIFWWKGLRATEVSRSTAIYSSNPIYTSLIAVIFLSEQLSIIKWIAIFLIVAGTILCSYEKKENKKTSSFNIMYLLIILAALCASLGNIFSKVALQTIHPFLADILAAYVGLPLCLSLLFKKEVLSETVASIRNKEIIIPLIIRGFISSLAVVFFYLAMQAGPISLVSAAYGVNPVFVFAISIFLSLFFPKINKENLSREVLFLKFLAIFLIVGGVVLINF